jgi:hypothetical protein
VKLSSVRDKKYPSFAAFPLKIEDFSNFFSSILQELTLMNEENQMKKLFYRMVQRDCEEF